MGYISRYGRRPTEYASKSAHGYVIKDPSVQELLANCSRPKRADEVSLAEHKILPFREESEDSIRHIIAIDGSYNEVAVELEFPSSTICFFQMGALIFSIEDLEKLEEQPFIDPGDIAKLKQIQRLEFALPTRNLMLNGEANLINSVRRALYNFFIRKIDDSCLMETLRWFVFQEYSSMIPQWLLASCPHCNQTAIPLQLSKMKLDFTFPCGHCGKDIFLTDVFRLHEAIDNELGAGGILGYVATSIEQIVLVHLIKIILSLKPDLLKEILFIKDGPLAFFGQTANMHQPMRALVQYLLEHHDLHLAGLEKSGPFVEHADEIRKNVAPGSVLILDNKYIYRYILPCREDAQGLYGRSTYYSHKVIFKTGGGAVYVVSVPVPELKLAPNEADLPNLWEILTNIEKLKCDMYDNSLIPVALANKLISLANHPSSKILQRFAISTVPHYEL